MELWHEVADHYSEAHRHYHSLEHLRHLFSELEHYDGPIAEPDALALSIFYHDIVYRAGRRDNEIRSAALLKERLLQTSFPHIPRCEEMILATRDHRAREEADTNVLLDLDLSILGASEAEYVRYTRNIREEYLPYPDFIYYRGRKKVVQGFLDWPRIYKTAFFHDKYEERARANLSAELSSLGRM